MTPNYPKLLPWLAKKAGIPEHRARALWHEASRYAASRAPAESSPYFKIAVDRLLELVAAESLRADAASFGLRPMVRAQNRLWAAAISVMETASVMGERGLRLLNSQAT